MVQSAHSEGPGTSSWSHLDLVLTYHASHASGHSHISIAPLRWPWVEQPCALGLEPRLGACCPGLCAQGLGALPALHLRTVPWEAPALCSLLALPRAQEMVIVHVPAPGGGQVLLGT